MNPNQPSPGLLIAGVHSILAPANQVVQAAKHVRVDAGEIERVADWMAGEELPWPDFRSALIPTGNDADTCDFVFLAASINFAFTDFSTGEVFRVLHEGVWRSDSEAMMACLKRAWDGGVPVLEGDWLRRAKKRDLEKIFEGSIPIPMLDERLRIFREIGHALGKNWGGRFHRFLGDGPHYFQAGPRSLGERLAREFPSFEDVSQYRGRPVPFQKRAQLMFWQLHRLLGADGFFKVEDLEQATIFADYIVPLALRLFGVLVYTPELDEAIRSRQIVPADSEEEIEIRAASIWACRLLTEAINQRRPPELRIIDPVLDARLWTHYHASHLPHHLTVTTDY